MNAVPAATVKPPPPKRRGRRGAELVGRVFQCPDDTVRWIVGQNTRGHYRTLWLTDDNRWHQGATFRVDDWPGGEERPAPAVGTRIKRIGALGDTYDAEVMPDGSHQFRLTP